MKKLRTLHIYGDTKIQSRYCPTCNQTAFVVERKLTCCGRPVESLDSERFKIEIDTINHRRRPVPAWLRAAILEEQKNRCFYCGDEFGSYRKLNGVVRQVRLEWDHVVPFSYNGNNADFVAACKQCNAAKHARMFSTMQEAKTFCRIKLNERKTNPGRG